MNYFSSDELAFADAAQKTNVTAEKAEKSQLERRYKRGYDTRHLPREIRLALRDAEASDLWGRIREAVLTVASIPGIAIASTALILTIFNSTIQSSMQIGLAVFAYLVACTFIARQLRGLEIMVHDASHLTWIRKNRKLNNRLADIFVGAPVLSSVSAYWKSHAIHHGHYGSHEDPCRQRFAEMGLGEIDLSTNWKITKAVVRWLPSYNAAYYREIGSHSMIQWFTFITWHAGVIVTPAAATLVLLLGFSLQTGIALAIFGWVLFWVLPAMVFLPVIRSIAESEEHDYDAGGTEFETTFTNDGWLHQLLIHPKNDAYHVIHHLFPNIPESQHRRIHKMLMEHDEKYRNALRRGKILEGA
ncbi:fatty acid desaturase family protein [Cognatishimia activa]|uniref:Fatty acid desaturase n=1 Tax=Cognatishimia activa TaxID=1715691 RepID=A0A0P1INK4_9RHOB|nr:fatty acid desaturase family protein [Cognatishimia activa]CUI26489.1 Fatty acid desaturase [Cognatishimia activa]CUK25172.1 Fatty acid desaturase [Cognatishimia activa]